MTILERKLRDVCDKLISLVPQFKKIYVKRISDIPIRINEIVIGQDKFKIFVDQSVEYEVNEDDLKYLTSIKRYMFWGCTNLTKVTFPDSIKAIMGGAFIDCVNLTDIYFKPTTPPTLGNTDAIPTTTTIHVPVGSGEAYKNATNWSYHSDRIVEDIQI